MSELQTEMRQEHQPLLEVTDLRTHFRTERGLVRAVDGVSLTLERGKCLGIVGESGSGKTVLSRSLMGLLPSSNTVTSGSVKFEGKEILGLPSKQMRRLWGREMSMVFQNPMTSLNPLMKIGQQIAEPLNLHLDMSRADARATAAAVVAVRHLLPGLLQHAHLAFVEAGRVHLRLLMQGRMHVSHG